MIMIAAMTMSVASAKVVRTNIKVNGYQPKAKIEAAAQSVKGVKKALYTEKNKILTVLYNNEQTAVNKIKAAVNKVDKKPAQAIRKVQRVEKAEKDGKAGKDGKSSPDKMKKDENEKDNTDRDKGK